MGGSSCASLLMIVPWVSGSRHRSRGSTEIVRDPAGFLLIPLQCLSQLFLWRPTCANLKTRLYKHARATPRPSRVASESNGIIERVYFHFVTRVWFAV